MNKQQSVFISFTEQYASHHEREAALELEVVDLQFDKDYMQGRVKDDKVYLTSINYTDKKITNAFCLCSYSKAGYCRHIVATLLEADRMLSQEDMPEDDANILELHKDKSGFTILHTHVLQMDENALRASSMAVPVTSKWDTRLDVRKAQLGDNFIVAEVHKGYEDDWMVRIHQGAQHIEVTCTCFNPSKKLCEHIHQTLVEIAREDALQLAFKSEERHRVLQKHAQEMGLTNVERPDDFFELSFEFNRLHIQPKYTMLNLSASETETLKKQLLPEFHFPKAKDAATMEFLVMEESPYLRQVVFTLYESGLTKAGDLKAPFEKVDLTSKLRSTRQPEELLFYAALLQQDPYKDLHELYADVVNNPLEFPVYFHQVTSDVKKISPKTVVPVTLTKVAVHAQIMVKQVGDFYVLTGEVKIDNTWYSTRNIQLLGGFFFSGNRVYFLQNETVAQVLKFFKSKKHEVFIHQTQFTKFREEFLEPLENNVEVHYSFVKKAPAKMIKDMALQTISEHLIYLSESEDYILITPVMMYGETEVNVLSKRTVLTENPVGTLYKIDRNPQAEEAYLKNIRGQHPSFMEDHQQPFFFLHRNEFLDGGWFLEAFDSWRKMGYSILGFNQLKNNRYNAHKMSVSTQIKSGIDWFDAEMKINFGKVEASLKDIQKAVTNKTRYVQLGDGTQGMLPEEWMQKFAAYFRHGEVVGNVLRTHKSNFNVVDDLYDAALLSEDVRMEIRRYKDRLQQFTKIDKVSVPLGLNATLRDYQKEGLNWLNFLDEFGFGGCLADDMGLGKTIQIISYILLQLEKGSTLPNLVVVPTSLLFNWQRELDKFAPSLKYRVLHGQNRATHKEDFSELDVVITTYGTMVADVEWLHKVKFNLIVLDESQAIKNPSSKRYKAARLLQARQRIVVTGTPIENNTFDLYAQLSFAMPGLLGSAKRFSDTYAMPIDKFQDTGRARELQQKIHPFILRRTKQQVAQELPEKTEMIIYCEMDTEQQRVYDLYKLEFQKYLAGLSDDELHSSSLHVLQGLTKLRQICNSPALLSDDEFYGDQSAKMTELMEQIDNLISQHKIVIFSQFVGMLELIRTRLDAKKIKYAYLTGQTKDREAQVELFQENEEVRIFLVSLKAGGTGLNLTAAEYVFLVDPWWNPAVENQAIDRAHRIGQTNKVVAVRLISPNTIEEKMLELQQRKKELSDDLIHTDQAVMKNLSKDDLLSLV